MLRRAGLKSHIKPEQQDASESEHLSELDRLKAGIPAIADRLHSRPNNIGATSHDIDKLLEFFRTRPQVRAVVPRCFVVDAPPINVGGVNRLGERGDGVSVAHGDDERARALGGGNVFGGQAWAAGTDNSGVTAPYRPDMVERVRGRPG